MRKLKPGEIELFEKKKEEIMEMWKLMEKKNYFSLLCLLDPSSSKVCPLEWQDGHHLGAY